MQSRAALFERLKLSESVLLDGYDDALVATWDDPEGYTHAVYDLETIRAILQKGGMPAEDVGEWLAFNVLCLHTGDTDPLFVDSTYDVMFIYPEKPPEEPKTFREALTHTINCFSKENGSNTPDFILAEYLECCLAAFDGVTQAREEWYGRKPRVCFSADTAFDTSPMVPDGEPVLVVPDAKPGDEPVTDALRRDYGPPTPKPAGKRVVSVNCACGTNMGAVWLPATQRWWSEYVEIEAVTGWKDLERTFQGVPLHQVGVE